VLQVQLAKLQGREQDSVLQRGVRRWRCNCDGHLCLKVAEKDRERENDEVSITFNLVVGLKAVGLRLDLITQAAMDAEALVADVFCPCTFCFTFTFRLELPMDSWYPIPHL